MPSAHRLPETDMRNGYSKIRIENPHAYSIV